MLRGEFEGWDARIGSVLKPFYAARFLNKFGITLPIPAESLYIGTMYHWYDMSKAHRELGFEPRPAISAIKKSIDWAIANGIL